MGGEGRRGGGADPSLSVRPPRPGKPCAEVKARPKGLIVLRLMPGLRRGVYSNHLTLGVFFWFVFVWFFFSSSVCETERAKRLKLSRCRERFGESKKRRKKKKRRSAVSLLCLQSVTDLRSHFTAKVAPTLLYLSLKCCSLRRRCGRGWAWGRV